MKARSMSIILAAVVFSLISCQAYADEVWLKNGDHLSGDVVSLTDGKLLLKTSYAGDIPILWEEVVSIQTHESVKVVLSDETALEGPILPHKEGKIRIKTEKLAGSVVADLADVTGINPEPPGPPLKIKFRANLGASFASGNTDNEDSYADTEFIARTEQNRYTIGGLYRSAESDGVKTESKKAGYMKYDHFFNDKWYAYANTSAERDKFKDLDVRYSLGLGAGYQFIESDRTNFSLEGGVSYVDEDYILAGSNSYTAGRWGLNFDHFLLPDSLQYFIFHTGLQSLEDSDDLVLSTQTGFRIPFYKNLNLSAQMNWDYDKSPSPGKKESDYAYIFSIGYQFSR